MAEQGVRSAGEDGGEAMALGVQSLAADRVDAAVDPIQEAGPNGPVDRTLGVSERPAQLADRDHAVLSVRQVNEGSMLPVLPRVRLSFP
jgi:hypothetical protein